MSLPQSVERRSDLGGPSSPNDSANGYSSLSDITLLDLVERTMGSPNHDRAPLVVSSPSGFLNGNEFVAYTVSGQSSLGFWSPPDADVSPPHLPLPCLRISLCLWTPLSRLLDEELEELNHLEHDLASLEESN